MKKILFSFLLISLTIGLGAQSRVFDVAKNTYDPYIAEKGGFESLFVNPAGMAGQTEIFTFDVEAGTAGATSTYEALEAFYNNSDLILGQPDPDAPIEDIDPADAQVMMELLVDSLQDSGDLDTITAGTSFDGWTAEQILIHFESGEPLEQEDADIIQANIESNPAVVESAVNNLLDRDLTVKIEASTTTGILLNGFGIGAYGNVYSIADAARLGFDRIIGESGVKVGLGFNLGPLALGASADFAAIGRLNGVPLDQLMVAPVVYGYAWGVDVGANFEIFPGFTVGAVFTDLIGSYSDAGVTSVEALMAGDVPSTTFDYDYTFDLDLDFGVTFAPQFGEGKIFAPSFSFDYYDFISLFRPMEGEKDLQFFLSHMRIGAEVELLSFINARAQYYQEFFTLGAGVDLLILEVFGEFMFDQQFEDIGAAAMVKLHF